MTMTTARRKSPIASKSLNILRHFVRLLVGEKSLNAAWVRAGDKYDNDTIFCNSIWTYGTDYLLTLVMWYLMYEIHLTKINSLLKFSSALLMFLYGWSTLIGGLCHQLSGINLDLNSHAYKVMWFCCVGSVAFVNGVFGLIGVGIVLMSFGVDFDMFFNLRSYGVNPSYESLKLFPLTMNLRFISIVFLIFGCFFTYLTWTGTFRHKRPAADIFFLGTCQAFGSAFCMVVLFLVGFYSHTDNEVFKSSVIFTFGLLGNMPLLWSYPWLIRLGFGTKFINTFLHTFLLVSWGSQGYGLWKLLVAFGG